MGEQDCRRTVLTTFVAAESLPACALHVFFANVAALFFFVCKTIFMLDCNCTKLTGRFAGTYL